MRHLKGKQLDWQIKRQQSRFAHSQKRKGKFYDTNKRFSVPKSVLGYKILEVPTKLVLYNLNDQKTLLVAATLSFFEMLRKNILANTKILIDFSNTTRIDAAALLIMYAITEESLAKYSEKVRFSLPNDAPHVRRQLRNSYYLRLLSRSDLSSQFQSRDALPVITGVGNNKVDNLIDYLMEKVFEYKATPEQEHIYADAISETVHNVGLHAYPEKSRGDKKWWLLSQVIDDQLYLAIYDTGVGIPKTVVKQSYFFGKLKDVFPKQFSQLIGLLSKEGMSDEELEALGSNIYSKGLLTDEQAIYLSLRPDVSGTQKDKHGQGSKSIKRLVEESHSGKLWVMSNRGAFVKEQKDEPSTYPLPGDLNGTLVQWNIQIK